jgi:hypothetical protein
MVSPITCVLRCENQIRSGRGNGVVSGILMNGLVVKHLDNS